MHKVKFLIEQIYLEGGVYTQGFPTPEVNSPSLEVPKCRE